MREANYIQLKVRDPMVIEHYKVLVASRQKVPVTHGAVVVHEMVVTDIIESGYDIDGPHVTFEIGTIEVDD